MADVNSATVQNFVTILLDYANGSLKRAVDGLTEEQVFHQPSSDTNTIAWLAWHMNRWKDWQGHLVTGEEQVWVRDGWWERFGIPAERTGIGDTSEQVAAFRTPPALLWGYTEAAHTTFIERVNGLSVAQLEEMVQYMPGRGEHRPKWRSILGVCSDTMKHTGQIEYLRGLITGKGWFGA